MNSWSDMKDLNVTVVNQTWQFINGESLESMSKITVGSVLSLFISFFLSFNFVLKTKLIIYLKLTMLLNYNFELFRLKTGEFDAILFSSLLANLP